MPAPPPHRDPAEHRRVPYLLPSGRVTVAHVLFMDLVAYSESNTERQATLVSELYEVVHSVAELQAARSSNRVIQLDTGDGMALVFLEDPAGPVRCAIEISQAIHGHPNLRLRMGINTGPVHVHSGMSHRRQVSGKGINYAQRAMDRCEAGHILVTAETVSILQDLEGWQDYLHDIGEYEVKHSVRLHLYNFYSDTVGNAAVPAEPAPLRRSLNKDPNDRRRSDRRQTDRDLVGELEQITQARSQPAGAGTAAQDRRTRKRLARVVAAGVGSLIVGGLAVWVLHVPESMPNPQLVHFRLELPADFASLTLSDLPLFSPDGSGIVVSGRSARKRQLWIRTVNSAGLRLLSGTEGSRSAVFSPDSRSLAIAIGPNLQRLDLRTGAIQPLSELRGVVTAWSREGVILVTEDNVIKRVMASGGPPKPVTELDASGGELGHHFARFLPDGRHFLFHARATSNKWEDTAVYVGAIGDLKFRKRLLRGTGPAVYAPPGWLLFTRDEVLLAQPFDPSKLEMRGESVRVAGPIGGARVAGLPPFAYSVSETGSLVWLAGSGGGSVSQLTWLDRSGKKLDAVGPRAEIANPVLSPDGKRVLATVRDLVTKARDIWIVDLVRGTNSRFTFGPADNYNPVWSADGVYVVFSSSRQGMMYIYRKRADGVGGEEELLASHVEKSVDSFSVDGKYVLYNQSAPAKPISIWALPLTGERKPMPVVEGAAPANHSQFSPNGRWIAYMSAESGQQPQVFVQTAPGSGGPSGKWQISNAGGAMPQWSLDGKELFFIWRNELMAAPVKSDATTFQHGAPVMLFEFRPGVSQRNHFTPSADGQRFLFAWPEETDETGQIHVILNWPALLKKKQEPMFGGER